MLAEQQFTVCHTPPAQASTLSDDDAAVVEAVEAGRGVARWLMEPGTVHEPSVLFEVLRQRPTWMARAACRGQPIELFFPGRGADVRPALELCRQCPVRSECAEYALGSYSEAGVAVSGVWGGTSERRRRQILHQRLAAGPGARSRRRSGGRGRGVRRSASSASASSGASVSWLFIAKTTTSHGRGAASAMVPTTGTGIVVSPSGWPGEVRRAR